MCVGRACVSNKNGFVFNEMAPGAKSWTLICAVYKVDALG